MKNQKKLDEAYEKLTRMAVEQATEQLLEDPEAVDDDGNFDDELFSRLFTENIEKLFESRDSLPWWPIEAEYLCEHTRDWVEESLRRGGFCYLAQGDSFKVLSCDKNEQWPIEYHIRALSGGYEMKARLLRIPAAVSQEERAEMRRRVDCVNEHPLWGSFYLDEEDGRVYHQYRYYPKTLIDDEIPSQIAAARMLLMLHSRVLCPEMDQERSEPKQPPHGRIQVRYKLKKPPRYIPIWPKEPKDRE